MSNCSEFNNLTLNCCVGTKLSIAGYLPFAHLFDTILILTTSPGGTNIDLAERFLTTIELARFS